MKTHPRKMCHNSGSLHLLPLLLLVAPLPSLALRLLLLLSALLLDLHAEIQVRLLAVVKILVVAAFGFLGSVESPAPEQNDVPLQVLVLVVHDKVNYRRFDLLVQPEEGALGFGDRLYPSYHRFPLVVNGTRNRTGDRAPVVAVGNALFEHVGSLGQEGYDAARRVGGDGVEDRWERQVSHTAVGKILGVLEAKRNLVPPLGACFHVLRTEAVEDSSDAFPVAQLEQPVECSQLQPLLRCGTPPSQQLRAFPGGCTPHSISRTWERRRYTPQRSSEFPVPICKPFCTGIVLVRGTPSDNVSLMRSIDEVRPADRRYERSASREDREVHHYCPARRGAALCPTSTAKLFRGNEASAGWIECFCCLHGGSGAVEMISQSNHRYKDYTGRQQRPHLSRVLKKWNRQKTGIFFFLRAES